MGFGASNIDVQDIVGDVDDQSLREELEYCREELEYCRHILADTEMYNGRHSLQHCHVILRHVFAQR